MTDDKRACLAFICGIKCLPYANIRMVLDVSRNKLCHYNVLQNSAMEIHLFDYNRHNYVRGTYSELFDYSSCSYFNILWNKRKIIGFDYQSKSHFCVYVNNTNIEILDYENQISYNYFILKNMRKE